MDQVSNQRRDKVDSKKNKEDKIYNTKHLRQTMDNLERQRTRVKTGPKNTKPKHS